MKRREFISLLGSAAAACRSRRVRAAGGDAGDRFLSAPDAFAHLAQAFREGLRENGSTSGRCATCASCRGWSRSKSRSKLQLIVRKAVWTDAI